MQQCDGTAVGRTCEGSLLVEALGVSRVPEPDQVTDFKLNVGGFRERLRSDETPRNLLGGWNILGYMFEATVGLRASRIRDRGRNLIP